MKVVKNRKLSQKILISILTALLLLNFILPTVTKATEDNYDDEVSALSGPIQGLVTLIGDAGMSLMQYVFVGNWDIIEKISDEGTIPEWVEKVLSITLPGGSILDYFGEYKYIDIPNFEISPESIFEGKIPAFDINFFNPSEDIINNNLGFEYSNEETIETYDSNNKEDVISKADDLLEQYGYSEGQNKTENKGTELTEYDNTATTTTYEWNIQDETTGNLYRYVLVKRITEGGTIQTFDVTLTRKVATEVTTTRSSSASILQSTVSYWYNALRNISIIGLLSVLVYIGIRIVLSSVAADKSRYKEMLKDWLVAICLLFFMHYFMNFTVTITQSISKALESNSSQTVQNGDIQDGTEEHPYVSSVGVPYKGDRLIGDIRLKMQLEEKLSARWAYTVIYLVIVIYTIIFAVMYLKRVIYMAFFTMIAPLVALTYPLDKARDGKAQAFDMWMKEYTFNALIQPFHLIIYYLLVTSAMELAVNNPLYALVAIGFMMPAEKILRKFFGFNKSETSGVLGGALGGAMIMQGINALTRKAGHSGGKKPAGADGKEKANKAVRTADSGKNMNDIINEIGDEDKTTINSNSSNSIPYGDSDYSAEQERLDELTAEGFRQGDEEWDKAKAELDRHKLDIPSEQYDDKEVIREVNMPESESNDNNEDTSNMPDEDETHRLRAAMSLAGRWTLKGAKLAIKGAGAVTLGTVGVAAGLASDDYSNVLKYGAAGAAAGGMIVGAGINKLPSTAYRTKETAQREREKFEQEAYSAAARKKMANDRADDQFMHDKAAIRLYKDKFNKTKDEYKEAMKDALEYRKYGITDNDTIIKAMKLKTKGLSDDRKDHRRVLVAGTATQLNRKDVDSYGERLMSRGHNKKSAEIIKRAIRDFNDWE